MRKKTRQTQRAEIEVWYDGCCEPVNPGGNASFGAVIKRGEEILWSRSGYIGSGEGMSNCVAEYAGMIGALEKLLSLGLQDADILVRGDNMMTIRQMEGRWRAKRGLYIPYYSLCKSLVARFSRIRFEWIPRELNGEADALSKQILVDKNVKFRIQPR